MKINEIFYTIQGEGYQTGRPAIFIRFADCNLNCPFCDTNFHTYNELTEEEIIKKVKNLQRDVMVVLTGGEPTLQVTPSLIDKLHTEGYYTAIETNGTNTINYPVDWITCSPKENSAIKLQQANEVKVVYTGQDVEKYRNITAEHYLLQPCSLQNTLQVVDYILQHPWWRLSLQTHKMIKIK